jgi:hypothetical protein
MSLYTCPYCSGSEIAERPGGRLDCRECGLSFTLETKALLVAPGPRGGAAVLPIEHRIHTAKAGKPTEVELTGVVPAEREPDLAALGEALGQASASVGGVLLPVATASEEAGPIPAPPPADRQPDAETPMLQSQGRSETASNDAGSEGDGEIVDLDQIAAYVHRRPRSMDPYKRRQKDPLPDPDFPGGAGKRDHWRWATIRPWRARNFSLPIPEHIPDIRRRR